MKQQARALVGYMEEQEAVQLLTGSLTADESAVAKARQTWQAAVAAVNSHGEFTYQDPMITSPKEAISALDAIAQRRDIQALLVGLEWSIGWIDLSKGVLSYQRIVRVDGAIDRVRVVAGDDLKAIVELCLPGPDQGQFQGAFDQSQLAFTASSLNPNLRVAGFQIASVASSPGGQPEQLFGFKLTHGSSLVQIAEYKGRWLVRDGYHRIFGLMSQGVTNVPCVIIRARTFEETGAGRPGFFGFELLFGTRPPLISDYLSDASADIEVPAVMRVIRLKAEEFVVPILSPDEPRPIP